MFLSSQNVELHVTIVKHVFNVNIKAIGEAITSLGGKDVHDGACLVVVTDCQCHVAANSLVANGEEAIFKLTDGCTIDNLLA